MEFHAYGRKGNPVVLVLHGMYLNYESNLFFTIYLQKHYRIIMPTFDGMCPETMFCSRDEEIRHIYKYLKKNNIKEVELMVASSIGADIGLEFLRHCSIPVNHILFDSGSLRQYSGFTRRRVFYANQKIHQEIKQGAIHIHSLYPGAPEEMKGIFCRASGNLNKKSIKNILKTCMTKRERPIFDKQMQKRIIFLYGTQDKYCSCRKGLMKRYPYSHYPVLKGWNHMEYQMRRPKEYAYFLRLIMEGPVTLIQILESFEGNR